MALLNKNKFLYRDRTLRDALSIMDDGNTYTADNHGQVASADKTFDFGTDFTQWPTKLAHNVFVTSSDDTSANETYEIRLDWATDSGFTDIKNKDTYILTRGDAGHLIFETPVYEQFLRIFFVLAGTTPSIVIAEANFTSG